MNIDQTFALLGGFGKYQKFLAIVSILVWILNAYNHLGIVFLAAKSEFRCIYPTYVENASIFQQTTWTQNTTQEIDQCTVQTILNSTTTIDSDVQKRTKCQKWLYDQSQITSSVISMWDLVCDRKWLVSIASSIYMSGLLVGVLTFGILADRFGRRLTLNGALFGLICMEFGVEFSPNMTAFIIFRFLVAFFTQGVVSASYVIAMEYVSPDKRLIPWLAHSVAWSFGVAVLPMVAYFVRDWRSLQLIYSCLAVVLFIMYIILMPESARWYYAQGQEEKGERLLRKVAKWNKTEHQLPASFKIHIQGNQRANAFDLLRTPEIRKRALIMYLYWAVTSMVYFGLFLNAGKLSMNIYLNLIISGCVEVMKGFLLYPIINFVGRRYPTVITMTSSGIFLLGTTLFHKDHWMVTALSLVGRVTIGASFSCAYLYSAELFPTLLRSAAVGTTSMFARVGGIFAPLIGLLDVFHPVIPAVIFGAFSLLAGFLSWFLPETKGTKLPDSVEEVEHSTRKTKVKDQDDFTQKPLKSFITEDDNE